MDTQAAREKLLSTLATLAYRYRPDEPFLLASGQMSPHYVECKKVTMYAPAMPLIGQVLYGTIEAMIDVRNISGVGGLTQGADPLATAVAYYSVTAPRALYDVDAFSVRKVPKVHGTRRLIEGPVMPEAQVVVLDDVATTGHSTVCAIRACKREGLIVGAVVVLVDRQEGGLQAIREELDTGVPVVSVFTLNDIQCRAGGRA